MKSLIKLLLPRRLYEFMRIFRGEYLSRRYFEHKFLKMTIGSYELEIPENHILVKLLRSQPYRDMCIGITAKYVVSKYPDCTIVDIGANIGDTAAHIATYVKNKLILIEASDYYFDILKRNTARLPNEIITKNILVSDGSDVCGAFSHWGGTASFNEAINGKTRLKTERLENIVDDHTRFIKTDTDGYDFKILLNSIDWLASVRPAILFENQIKNNSDLENADKLYSRLAEIGYAYFVVWDDPGFHLLSTTSVEVLTDLNRYLLKITLNDGHKSIYNYDVLCLHSSDKDVYDNISKCYRSY